MKPQKSNSDAPVPASIKQKQNFFWRILQFFKILKQVKEFEKTTKIKNSQQAYALTRVGFYC